MAGSWRAAALAVAMVCWAASSCMLGFPEEDLVGRLPGRSLFYYFAEAQDHAAGKPLTLWLNGGPYLVPTHFLVPFPPPLYLFLARSVFVHPSGVI